MALRATAACALGALLLAIATSETHAGFFDLLSGGSRKNASRPESTPSIRGSDRNSTETAKANLTQEKIKPTIELTVLPPAATHTSHRKGGGRGAGGRNNSRANATITVVVPPAFRDAKSDDTPRQKGSSESQPTMGTHGREFLPREPPVVFTTKTTRLPNGNIVATVDDGSGRRVVEGAPSAPASAPASAVGPPGELPGVVWGPYPTELTAPPPFPFAPTGQGNPFAAYPAALNPYGFSPLSPWWQSPRLGRSANPWFAAPEPYHPWNPYSYYGGPPMAASPYAIWPRMRRQSHHQGPFRLEELGDGPVSLSDSPFSYQGWTPFSPPPVPQYPYNAPYAFPWGPFSAPMVDVPWSAQYSAPYFSMAGAPAFANQPQPEMPPPPPPPAEADTPYGAEVKHVKGETLSHQQPHHIRHQKHRSRPHVPSWQLPQVQQPHPALQMQFAPQQQMLPSMPVLPQMSHGHPGPPPPPPPPPPSGEEAVPYHRVA